MAKRRSFASTTDWLNCPELNRKASFLIYVDCSASSSPSWPDPQVARLKLSTESLERAQRARLDRVLLDWEKKASQLAQPRKRHSDFIQPFVNLVWIVIASWLSHQNRRSEVRALETYLTAAHLHTAVARQSSLASRRWFADWRLHALAALRFGLSPRALVALLRSTPTASPTCTAPGGSVPRIDTDLAGFRKRLENVIFPNAPGNANSFRHLATGDRLATTRI